MCTRARGGGREGGGGGGAYCGRECVVCRFNPRTDAISGSIPHALLCVPIHDVDGSIMAVLQVLPTHLPYEVHLACNVACDVALYVACDVGRCMFFVAATLYVACCILARCRCAQVMNKAAATTEPHEEARRRPFSLRDVEMARLLADIIGHLL